MKNTTLKTALPKNAQTAAINAVNLRSRDNALVPVGQPETVTAAASGKLIAVINRSAILLDRRIVKISCDGITRDVGILPGDYRCCSVNGESVDFMTALGIWRLDMTGGQPRIDDFTADFPAIEINVNHVRNFSVATPPRELSGDYLHWAGPLEKDDARLIGADILNAYVAATEQAMAAGYFTQPLIVYYKLLDSRGALLYRSDLKIVTPSGYQGASSYVGEVALSGSAYRKLGAIPVDLQGFTIGFKAPAADSSLRKAAVAEIYASPMLDPVDYEGSIAVTFGGSDTAKARLGVRLPLYSGLSARLARLIGRLESAATRIAVINDPFSGEYAAMKPISSESAINPRRESSRLASLLQKPVEPADPLMREISLPHRFSAGVMARIADMAVWGDITPVAALPSGVLWTAAATVDQPWTAVTRVTIGEGDSKTVLSRSESGSTGCPLALSPLICYPSPQARRIEIVVTSSDGVRRGVDLKLDPDPSGVCSCFVSPSLKPVDLAEGAEAISPVVIRHDSGSPSLVVVADAADPFAPLVVKRFSSGRVTAVAESPRYSGSLDIGRRSMAVFTSDGIFLTAVNASKRTVSCSCVDSRGVDSAGAVAVSPQGIYAVAGSSLLLVAGGKVRDVARGKPFSALAYSCRFGELLCLCPGGSMEVMDSEGRWSRRDVLPGIEEFCVCGAGLYASVGHQVFDINRENALPVHVSYSILERVRSALPRFIRGVVWGVASSSFDGDLTVAGSCNGVDEVKMSRLHVAGRVNVPPRMTLLGRPYRNLRFTVDATMSPGGAIDFITII